MFVKIFLIMVTIASSFNLYSAAGKEELLSAVTTGKPVVTEALLKGSLIYDVKDKKGLNLLSLAIKNERLGKEIIGLLIDKVSTEKTPNGTQAMIPFLTDKDNKGGYALLYAAENKKINLASIVGDKINWNKIDEQVILRSIFAAIQLANNNYAMTLMKKYSDLDLQKKLDDDPEEYTAILVAAENNNWEMVKNIILENKETIHDSTKDGVTAFMKTVSVATTLKIKLSADETAKLGKVYSDKDINLIDLFMIAADCAKSDAKPKCEYVYLTDSEVNRRGESMNYNACFYACPRVKDYLISDYGQCEKKKRTK